MSLCETSPRCLRSYSVFERGGNETRIEIDDFTQYHHELLEGVYDCTDRIVVNGCFPLGQEGGGLRVRTGYHPPQEHGGVLQPQDPCLCQEEGNSTVPRASESMSSLKNTFPLIPMVPVSSSSSPQKPRDRSGRTTSACRGKRHGLM